MTLSPYPSKGYGFSLSPTHTNQKDTIMDKLNQAKQFVKKNADIIIPITGVAAVAGLYFKVGMKFGRRGWMSEKEFDMILSDINADIREAFRRGDLDSRMENAEGRQLILQFRMEK